MNTLQNIINHTKAINQLGDDAKLYTRYAYNDIGIPVAVSYEIKKLEFYYTPPKNENEKETIQVFDLDEYPAGKGTNGSVPGDVITYDQDTVPEEIGCYAYSEMIVKKYIETVGGKKS